MKLRKEFLVPLLVMSLLLNTGTVRRKRDALLRTQTDPIKLKDKMEELKDGEKGPATPQFGWYGSSNGFMGAPPVSPKKNIAEKGAAQDAEPYGVTEVDSIEGENAPPVPAAQPVEAAEERSEEDGNENLADKADNEEDVAQPSSVETVKSAEKGTKKEPNAKSNDKDWWEEI